MILIMRSEGIGGTATNKKKGCGYPQTLLATFDRARMPVNHYHFHHLLFSRCHTVILPQTHSCSFTSLDLLIRFFDHFYHDIFVPLFRLVIDVQDRSHVLNNRRRYILDGWSLSRFFFHFRQHL